MDRDISSQEIESWTRTLHRVWQPTRIVDIRPRVNGGVLFLAEVAPSLRLHMGVQNGGVDLCALWCGEDCLLWDSLIGFCSSWSHTTTPETKGRAEVFASQMMPSMRRNCFLMGCKIESTEEERHTWAQGANSQPNTKENNHS